MESAATEDWPLHLVSKMNGDAQQAEFHNVSVQEPSENICHGELLVSKETLPPSRHDDDNIHDLMIASRETFQ